MEVIDIYKTLGKRSEGLFKDKGSRFIAHAIPCTSEEQVKEEIEALKKQYYDARHHCYAYILGYDKEDFRANDDGEPSGTAGKPILGQLLSHDLTDCLIVVIRYFGGVKLGVRGLINAYKFAAQDAIQNNQIITKIVKDQFDVTFEYADMNDVMRIIKEEDLEIVSQDFQMTCKLRFSIRQKFSEKVEKRFCDLRKLQITKV
ncbi:MAG: YigZ family protein [Bacteroidales bacterium]|nr:YigZ family protein [Bacteroidales bacterium]